MSFVPRSIRARRVFFDSAAYLALIDTQDEHHDAAVALLTRLADARYRPFTSNAVIFDRHFSQYGLVVMTPELV